MKDALQTLLEGGVGRHNIESICSDIVAADSDNRWAVLLAWFEQNGDNVDPEDIEDIDGDENYFSAAGGEYRVLTDEEADALCEECIIDSVWAFRPEWLESMTGIDAEAFAAMQSKCEDCNSAILSIIKSTCGIDSFVKESIAADGRGHQLSGYDGEESDIKIGGQYYYIYRIN